MHPEAEFSSDEVVSVGPAIVASVKSRARSAPRGRFRLCLHHSTDDRVQEMLIACPRGTYFRPHRHPEGRSESIHVVEGEMSVLLLDDDGCVQQRVALSAPGTSDRDGAFLYRLSARRWHIPVFHSEFVVYHEVYAGPLDVAAEPHPLSPDGADPDQSASYLARLLHADPNESDP